MRRFKQSNQDFIHEFSTSLVERDQEKAVLLAHTLKGTSGNIGAMTVFSLAANLELAAKDSLSGLGDILEELKRTLSEVLIGLETMEARLDKHNSIAEGPPDNITVSSESVTLLIEQLQQQIGDFDTDASETLDELESVFSSGSWRPYFKSLSDAISAYDFETAEEKAAALKQV